MFAFSVPIYTQLMVVFVIIPLVTEIFGVMPISILQWRAEIGIFNTKLVKYPFKSKYWAMSVLEI